MRTKLLPLLCVCVLFAGCGGDDGRQNGGDPPDAASSPDAGEASPTPEEPEVVDGTLAVRGGEWSFSAPAEAVAGPTMVTYENTGEMSHELIVATLPDEPPLAAIAEMDDRKQILKLVKQVGASGRVFTGETSEPFEVNLKPGAYGLLCLLESPRGRTHAWVGMAAELTVQ